MYLQSLYTYASQVRDSSTKTLFLLDCFLKTHYQKREGMSSPFQRGVVFKFWTAWRILRSFFKYPACHVILLDMVPSTQPLTKTTATHAHQ